MLLMTRAAGCIFYRKFNFDSQTFHFAWAFWFAAA
jgi:hypothetical protein